MRTGRHGTWPLACGLVVLAVSRQGETLRSKIGEVRLKLGDILLVQGTRERLNHAREQFLSDYRPRSLRIDGSQLEQDPAGVKQSIQAFLNIERA